MAMKLSFVIPTFNRVSLLERLLLSIQNLDIPSELEMTIIVVNDGSTDRTLALLEQQFPAIHIINGDGNWWWTKCINEGMQTAFASQADCVLWMNDDNELPQNYLIELIKAYGQLPNHSIIGSASVSIDLPRKIDASGYVKHNKLFNKLYANWPIGSIVTAGFTG